MRKLTYFIATSFDGFIAREDGGIDDFTFEGEHVAVLLNEYPETIPTHLRPHLNVTAANRHFDTVLMGRATYEVGLALGVDSPYQHLRQYVFSKSLPQDDSPENLHIVPSNAIEHVRQLKLEDGLGIWLCGGPILASSLLGEIDDVIVKVNPFLMGSGKTLLAENSPKLNLIPVSRRDYDNGFAIAHFCIDRTATN